MKIRKFEKTDAGAASHITNNCFLNLDIGGHTKKGIELQIERNIPENLIKRAETIKYFVATDNSKLIGICGHDAQKVPLYLWILIFKNAVSVKNYWRPF